MRTSRLAIVLFAIAFLFGFFGTAGATLMEIPDTLDIDFREDRWQKAVAWDRTQITRTVDDGVIVQAEVDAGSYLTWQQNIGMGISNGDDRVNRAEIFEIDFDKNDTLVSYAGLWLTGFAGDVNLLTNPSKFEIELQIEEGDDTTYHILDLDGRVSLFSDGAVYISLLDTSFPEFNEIDIQLYDYEGEPEDRIKFWVAGLDGKQPVPTPEPATMLLLGTGLIGLAGFGRRKLLKRNKG